MTITFSLALLVLRLVAGLTLAAHGAQKLFGWFGGSGWTASTQGMQKQGFKPEQLWSGLSILGELGGGLSLAFGFLTPLGAAGAVGSMFMAVVHVHWKHGFWNRNHGMEFPLQLLASSLAIGLAGPGSYSLDALFRIALPETLLFSVLAIVALLVDIIGMIITHQVVRTSPESASRAS